MSMGLHEDQTANRGDVAERRDVAGNGRAAAMLRRRALAAGRSALPPAHERVRTGFRQSGLRPPATAVYAIRPTAHDSQGAPNGAPGASGETAVATEGVASAHLGRALSMQRRRQLSQGKQALNGGGDRTSVAADAGRPAFIVHHGGAR